MGPDLRVREDQRRIHIRYCVSSRFDPAQRFFEEYGRISALPSRVGRRKQRSDIGCSNGPEQRIGDGVKQDVTVGVTAQTFGMFEVDSADLERNSSLELVRVPTIADAELRGRRFRLWRHGKTLVQPSRNTTILRVTVYVKKNWYAYNFGMRKEAELVGKAVLSIALLLTTCVAAQQTQSANEPVITTKELPVAGLWDFYSVRVETEGTQALTWRAVNGSLPHNLELHEFGRIDGVVNEQGTFEVEIVATGQGGARSKPKRFKLEVERPLKTDWSLKSQVNGSRIEGSIKVSNTTGRDFDLSRSETRSRPGVTW